MIRTALRSLVGGGRAVFPALFALAVSCGSDAGRSAAEEANPEVWVDLRAGTYSCRGSPEFEGDSEGQLALESDARLKGYRSATNELCGDGTMLGGADSAGAALGVASLPENPGPEVWVNTGSDVYHCAGSPSFEAPAEGRLMSERAARTAGYGAADGRECQ